MKETKSKQDQNVIAIKIDKFKKEYSINNSMIFWIAVLALIIKYLFSFYN